MGEGSVLQNAVPRCSRKGGLEAARSSGSGAAAAVEVGSPHTAFHAANQHAFSALNYLFRHGQVLLKVVTRWQSNENQALVSFFRAFEARFELGGACCACGPKEKNCSCEVHPAMVGSFDFCTRYVFE